MPEALSSPASYYLDHQAEVANGRAQGNAEFVFDEFGKVRVKTAL